MTKADKWLCSRSVNVSESIQVCVLTGAFDAESFYFISKQKIVYTSLFTFLFSKDDFYEKTSISPIPRPVSSLNMTTLMQSQQFPVCLTPPPSPAVNAPQPSPKFNTFNQQQQQQQQQAEGGSSSTAEEGEVMSSTIKRALSCDSVCSDTSVALGDLEEPNITGYLCVGLEYDR